jgi:hypothetical protein
MDTVVARARVDRMNERVELVADVDADVVGAKGAHTPHTNTNRAIDAQPSMHVTHARYPIADATLTALLIEFEATISTIERVCARVDAYETHW